MKRLLAFLPPSLVAAQPNYESTSGVNVLTFNGFLLLLLLLLRFLPLSCCCFGNSKTSPTL
ncbi:hypothetical protein DM01DRAFT_1333366 [Hesseltinella vesiculosa]|uniref:Uncharacterized protein n=1 Tax=Hesseltinella vesiculosa TaxID=101127 RepID=A0A1X2GR32_9FUNG|nr:hypothetical protein DM01DRAFT_1333366 [Hesseltinella vesiculosa]